MTDQLAWLTSDDFTIPLCVSIIIVCAMALGVLGPSNRNS